MRHTVFAPAWLDELAELRGTLTSAELAEVTAGFVLRPQLWRPLVHHDPSRRWFERLLLTSMLEVWLIGWAPGQETAVHDHGGSSGGMTVAEGVMAEEIFQAAEPAEGRAEIRPHVVATGRRVTHTPGVPVGFPEAPGAEWGAGKRDQRPRLLAPGPGPARVRRGLAEMTVDELLAGARARLVRLQPGEAAEARDRGALLVDIRPQAQRAEEGGIPGAVVIERNVLEWRLDPTSPWRIPEADSHRREVIVFCSQGYTSSLAAASLQDLGLVRATDLVGGFQAWAQVGLPTEP